MTSKILVSVSIATSLAVIPASYTTNDDHVTLLPPRAEHGEPLENEFARIMLSSWHSSDPRIEARPASPRHDEDERYEEGIRSQVSALWAEDWDSDEDSVYDTW